MIQFESPKNQSSIIKVIGVGGGGSNAVNYMHRLGIEGVDFVVCNTDSQALHQSPVVNKIQLGPALTHGLGAGANPEIGKQSCEESMEEVHKILKVNTRMAFITAGMGGGTGTGGAPVIAKICKDLNILTVGIVTTPFPYEGRKRMKQAHDGIERMREHVDTILIISNDKLRQQFGNLAFTQAFSKADDILATAAKCIIDVITSTGQINVDFADVCTVMKNGGSAILGNAAVAGENRALEAVEQALNSPLLNDSDIKGAKWLLLNITSSQGEFEHTMDEAEMIQAYVQQMAGDGCDVILGMGHDPSLNDKIGVTVIATGFHHNEIRTEMPFRENEPKKINVVLGDINAMNTINITDAPKETKPTIPAPKPLDNLMPILMEAHIAQVKMPSIFEEPKAEPVAENFILNIEPAKEEAPTLFQEETKNEDLGMHIVMKTETQINDAIPVKIGERVLSAEEIEDKRRFEEQKRALEERADRLRRMSFNIKGADNNDEMENTPAYMRKNVKLDNQQGASTETHYSGYTIGGDDKGTNGFIQTINTFLDGKKPD